MFMCSRPAGIWSFGEKAVDSGQVRFIKNGIESERFAFNEEIRVRKRCELNLGDRLVIGHVGRFVLPKNHTFLIDIFAEIHKLKPNAVLMLVSDGPLMEEIQQKVKRLRLDNAVLFLGKRSDVNELMQAMDIFILPSLWEGLPLTGVEAQAAGLPTMMSDSITEEVCITPYAHMLPLNSGAKAWAGEALKLSETTRRTNTHDSIVRAGFDIRETAQWLESFYLEHGKSRA